MAGPIAAHSTVGWLGRTGAAAKLAGFGPAAAEGAYVLRSEFEMPRLQRPCSYGRSPRFGKSRSDSLPGAREVNPVGVNGLSIEPAHNSFPGCTCPSLSALKRGGPEQSEWLAGIGPPGPAGAATTYTGPW